MKLTSLSHLTIVVPGNATSREQFAAEELATYLHKIFTGISVCIAQDAEAVSGDRILIGGPERNGVTAAFITVEEFQKTVPGPEGIMLKAFGDDVLVVAGSSGHPNECERGTVYAVYELLERYLGCSFGAFVNPDIAGGEYVPALSQCDLSCVDYVKPAADNTYRTAIAENSSQNIENILNFSFIDWLAKNRYNRILTWNNKYERFKKCGLLEEAEKRGIRFSIGHHDAIPVFLPAHGNEYFPEHYYETHPEYYRLMQETGERFEITDHFGGWCLCSRNPELPDVMANNIIEWIGKNPSVDTIAFWPLDGSCPNCICPECAQYKQVENYTYFLNEVAKRIGAAYPDIKIDMLSYSALSDCPADAKLEPSLFVDKATWHYMGLRTIGKPDGSCLAHTFREQELLAWKKAGASVVYYDYYMGIHSARQRYMPAADEIQALSRRCMEVGIDGSGTQIEFFNHWNNIFNFYTFGRTYYDSNLSMEDNLIVFAKIFGEGASCIAEIIRRAEACLDGQVDISKAGLYLMDNLEKGPVYALFEKALTEAATPAARNNIRMMRMAFRYSDVECANTLYGRAQMRYKKLEDCADPTGELYYMSRTYDTIHWNNPGFAIEIPVDCEKQAAFVPDKWYDFEAK